MSATSASPSTTPVAPSGGPSKRSLRTNYERSPAKHVAPKSNIACRAQAMTLRVWGGKSYEEIEKLTGMKQRQVVKFINQAKELGWKPDGADMEETMLREEYLSAAALHKVQDKKIVEVMTSKYQVSKTTAKRSLERAKEQGWADKLREVAEDSPGSLLESRRSISSTAGGEAGADAARAMDLDADADGEPDDNVVDQQPVVTNTQQVSPPSQRRQHPSHPPNQSHSHINTPPLRQQPASQNQQHQPYHNQQHQHAQAQNQPHQHHRHSITEEGLLEQNLRTQAMGYLQYEQPAEAQNMSSSTGSNMNMNVNIQGQDMSLGMGRHS